MSSLSFLFLFPFYPCIKTLVLTTFPSFQKHEELVWLVGNLKLELTKYSRQLYSGRDGENDDDDDDDGSDGVGGSESTLSHQLRKRRF